MTIVGIALAAASLEPSNSLANVKVGDFVELVLRKMYEGDIRPTETYKTRVTQVNKQGRIFICVPSPERFKNWRYGFDPATGRSPHDSYTRYTMRAVAA